MEMTRRRFLAVAATTLSAGTLLSACSSGDDPVGSVGEQAGTPEEGWQMPAEDAEHEATWMCWPSSRAIWERDLVDVQEAIALIALAIAEFEPVRMLARPGEISGLRRRLGAGVDVIAAPVDDLWARDTLPCFLTRDRGSALAATARIRSSAASPSARSV